MTGDILSIIFMIGIALGIMSGFFLDRLGMAMAKVKHIINQKKEYRKLQKNVDAMKAKGDVHQWMDMKFNGTIILVCEKTGWAPTLQGFIPMHLIRAYREEQQSIEDFKSFRAARIELIARENQMTVDQTERLVEQVFSIRKDFALQRIDKLQAELAQRAQEVLDGHPKH